MKRFHVTLSRGQVSGEPFPLWAKDLFTVVSVLLEHAADVIAVSEVRTMTESIPPPNTFPFLVTFKDATGSWSEIMYAADEAGLQDPSGRVRERTFVGAVRLAVT